jgi:hypothetical protein
MLQPWRPTLPHVAVRAALLALFAILLAASGCSLIGGGEPTATVAPTRPAERPTITPPAISGPTDRKNDIAAAPTLMALPIYDDQLSPSWSVEQGNGAQVGEQTATSRADKRALQISTTQDYGTVTFAVRPDSLSRYARANYVATRFWINPGDKELAPSEIVLAVYGSDRLSVWGGTNRTDAQTDVSSATLVALGYDRPLPANTWTPIEAWFGRLEPSPRFNYITAVAITRTKGAASPWFLSELHLVGTTDPRPPAIAQASSAGMGAVLVRFSEAVEATGAGRIANYTIASKDDPSYASPVRPTSAIYDPGTFTVRLALPAPLKAGSTYMVQAGGIADLSAPANVTQLATATFAVRVGAIQVDVTRDVHLISPLIYGVTNAPADYLRSSRPTLNSWGGITSTRYNWELGNAWNLGRDGQYRNTDLGYRGRSASEDFVGDSIANNADVRITLPTMGWVARNANSGACSFPLPDGTCGDANRGDCQRIGLMADPTLTSSPSNVDSIVRWVKQLTQTRGYRVRIFAFDNEPDQWGSAHYDVHPKCTTYDEMLTKYLEYATAVRAVAPNAELAGPVVSGWNGYWNSPAGIADRVRHDNLPFLQWFLRQARANDERIGKRTLDILDIHYTPAAITSGAADARAAEVRLRSTRSLWDRRYVDESAIHEPVYVIPRMLDLIAREYPGTKLGISQWSWGAEQSVNGALAIVDVLGILGREGVFMAAHASYPSLTSPSYQAFRLYTNYDGRGGRFGDTSVYSSGGDSDLLSTYASVDSASKRLYVMVVNKDPANDVYASLAITGLDARRVAATYRYGQANPKDIVSETLVLTPDVPIRFLSYSATLLVIEPAQ